MYLERLSLPDHFHCLWTLPTEDQDLSVRLRLIKTYVTKHYGQALAFIAQGIYPKDWGKGERATKPQGSWDD